MLLQSLIMSGAVSGFFFAALLRFGPNRYPGYQSLSLWMSVVCLQLLFYYDSLSPKPIMPIPLQIVGFSMPLLSSPLLYAYSFRLTGGKLLSQKTMALHIIPFIIFLSCGLGLCLDNNSNLAFQNAVPQFGLQSAKWVVFLMLSLLAVVPCYYTVASLRLLRRYRQMLLAQFSYTEEISLNWLRWTIISHVVLFILLFSLIKFGVRFNLVNYQNLFAIVGTVLSAYVFFMGFCAISQQQVIVTSLAVREEPMEEFTPEIETEERYKNSGLSFKDTRELFATLNQHMCEKQPYLQDDLSLATLAEQLNFTPNQLSQIINQQANAKFFNFVNRYRVEAVKSRLTDPALNHLSILGIAYDCGFRSKSAFNKIFKEVTGQTPLQYRKGTL